MSVLPAIANALPPSPPLPSLNQQLSLLNQGMLFCVGPCAGAVVGGAPPTRPVLQFVPLPVTLDSRLFAGARSNANPNGDLRPLRTFRDLVDPLPNFSAYFVGGPDSTEEVYCMILNGAVADSANSFAAMILDHSRRHFAEMSFTNLDGTPGVWRPV